MLTSCHFCFKTMEIRMGMHMSKLYKNWDFRNHTNVQTWISVKLHVPQSLLKPSLLYNFLIFQYRTCLHNIKNQIYGLKPRTCCPQHTSFHITDPAYRATCCFHSSNNIMILETICCSLTTILTRTSQIPGIKIWLHSWADSFTFQSKSTVI